MKHLTASPNVESIPSVYRTVITRALAKDPEVRYNNVPEMLADLPWPEIAEQGNKIVNENAIGPVPVNGRTAKLPNEPEEIVDAEIDNRAAGARLRPLFNRGNADIVLAR